MNRSAQNRLAEIANEPFEHLDGIDLTWYAIGRIDAMQNHINKLQSELAELRKDRDRLDWMVAYDGEIRTIFSPGNAYCYAVYKEANGSFNFQYCTYGKTPREAIDNAMKEVK